MRNPEIRGFVAVLLVAAAIVTLVVRLDYDDDPDAASGPTTTVPEATTTAVPTVEDTADALCALVLDLRDVLFDRLTNPALQPTEDLLAIFYAEAAALPLGSASAEYAAASDFYRRYVEAAGPYAFDPERIVVEAPEDVYLSWRSLVTGEALGVEAANAQVGFACGVAMPAPPIFDLDALEDLERDFEREREDFQEELEEQTDGSPFG